MESFRDDSVQDSSVVKSQDSFQTEAFEPSKPNLKNIRPLTQAYQSPSSQAQVCVSKKITIFGKNMCIKGFTWKKKQLISRLSSISFILLKY